MTDRSCLLCGHSSKDVEHTIVRWKEPVDGSVFGMVDRCRDRAACFRRVEAAGGTWEVEDAGRVAA